MRHQRQRRQNDPLTENGGLRDRLLSLNPPLIRRKFARIQERATNGGLRGGPGRTRTANQIVMATSLFARQSVLRDEVQMA